MTSEQNETSEPLSQALVRDYQSPDWAAAVLRVLGNHIRWLEDKNRELQYANDSHEAFRQFDRDQIRSMQTEIESKLEGSITEQLALDNNALIERCREWTAWAGQAKAFRKEAQRLIFMMSIEPKEWIDDVTEFKNHVWAGAYDIIPLPGGTKEDTDGDEQEGHHGQPDGREPGRAPAAVAAADASAGEAGGGRVS